MCKVFYWLFITQFLSSLVEQMLYSTFLLSYSIRIIQIYFDDYCDH